MKVKVIYEDKNTLVVEKPPKIVVFSEKGNEPKSLINYLLEQFPHLRKTGSFPRYGIVHRLDKDTSGILLVAKNDKTLFFLQKQFQYQKVFKRYLALVSGDLKKKTGKIETLMGRSPQNRIKQKVFTPLEPKAQGKRRAVTEYKSLERLFDKKGNIYTLVEVYPKTGRKHQIRAHFHYLGHPIAGDNLYAFKKQPTPEDLERQFLHADFLRIRISDKETKEFKSELPDDLKKVLHGLKKET
jgi:23S rRNA pseudouridine1911/1915/1917 synthase